MPLLVKVQIACFSSSSTEPGYSKIELAWRSLPIRTHIISFKVFARESIAIKSLFFTPVLPEAKARGWEWKCLPPHHTSSFRRPCGEAWLQIISGRKGPLKYPSSYLRSCRPDSTSRLSLGQTLVSGLTVELAEPWDLRELNPRERSWHQSYPQSQGRASNWSPDLEDKK